MRMTDRITALKEKLCILPRAPPKGLADDGEIVCFINGEEIVEDFKMLGFPTCMIKWTDLDHLKPLFQKSRRAQHIERELDKLVGGKAPDSAIKAVMARRLREKGNRWPGKEKGKWRNPRNKALQWLWLHPDLVKAAEEGQQQMLSIALMLQPGKSLRRSINAPDRKMLSINSPAIRLQLRMDPLSVHLPAGTLS
jgi:hypothetical protein